MNPNQPAYGTTARAHIDRLMAEVDSTLGDVFTAVRGGKRFRPQERDAMTRRLAGVIGSCETLRLWLQAGAR